MRPFLPQNFYAFILLFVLAISVQAGLAQPSPLRIEMNPYNWSEDMKRLSETTPELALTLQFILTNTHEHYHVSISRLEIKAEVRYEGKESQQYDKLQLPLYIPPKGAVSNFLRIRLKEHAQTYGVQNDIGKWSVSVTYEIKDQVWHDARGFRATEGWLHLPVKGKIEPYPFDLKVVSAGQLQDDIQQKIQRPLVELKIGSITINILEIGIGSVAGIIIALILLLRRRKIIAKST